MHVKIVTNKLKVMLSKYGLGLSLLITWEIVGRSGIISPIILCSFTDVVKQGFLNFNDYLPHIYITLTEIGLALLIAWGFGLIIGVIVGGIGVLGNIFTPLLSSLYAVPIVIIYPVIAAWLGLGIQSKYIFGGIYGFFPVVLNAIVGIQSVDRQYLSLIKSLGASRYQSISQVKMPFALPEILAGIRLGAALAVIGVVVAEMLASSAGLGYLIEYNRTIFRTANVYFAILIVLVIVGIIDRILYQLEKKLLFWTL